MTLFELLGEIAQRAAQGIRRCLAQPAYGSVFHRAREIFEQRLIPRRLLHQHRRFRGADTAGRALTATLVFEKPHRIQRSIACAIMVGKDDDRSGTDKAAMRLQGVKIVMCWPYSSHHEPLIKLPPRRRRWAFIINS